MKSLLVVSLALCAIAAFGAEAPKDPKATVKESFTVCQVNGVVTVTVSFQYSTAEAEVLSPEELKKCGAKLAKKGLEALIKKTNEAKEVPAPAPLKTSVEEEVVIFR